MSADFAKRQFFVCDCGDPTHQFITTYYPNDEDFQFLAVEILLNNSVKFWKRLWHGLRYAFGYKSRYGAFDEVLLNKDDAQKLKKFLEEFIENISKQENVSRS
jgi:hypothetical protein